MTLLFWPRDQVVKIQNNTSQMSKVDIETSENSLDNSGDGELLGMVDEGSFGSGESKPHLSSHSFLDTEDEPYTFRDISGRVTYRLVSQDTVVQGEDTTGPFFVIENPADVFGSPAIQKKVNQRDPAPSKVMTAKKRDDKRRATHNEIERRRRDKINSWITKLAALVPNSGLPDSASKGGILAKACDYITELTEKQKRLEQVESENKKLVIRVLKLNEEVTELMKENNLLKSKLADNCIAPLQRPKPEP